MFTEEWGCRCHLREGVQHLLLELLQRRLQQLPWCPVAALQAERLPGEGHFQEALRASLGIQATRLTFFAEGPF
jgi:hypothetical protein